VTIVQGEPFKELASNLGITLEEVSCFWVYEDLATNRARVHEESCGFCNNGAGKGRKKIHPNETKWHGPFGSLELAKMAADGTGRRDVAVHSCCELQQGRAKSSPTKRFSLPDVDESSLGLPDLFHRRMLEIYIRMRDEIGYNAVRFLGSVRRHGGVEHAKRSLRRPVAMQSGLQRLCDEGRLGESMEAHVCEPKFASLFTPNEISEARRRLQAMKDS
jgi:hypothetical protein